MGQIRIRNLDDSVIEALRALAEAVGMDRVETSRRLAEVRQLIGRLEGVSTLEYLRADRRRDNR